MSSILKSATIILALAVSGTLAPMASAQSVDETQTATPLLEATTTDDEVIAYGRRIMGQHDGLNAFMNGDYITAEIEFEREIKSLRRFKSERENAAFNADVSFDRAQASADFAANTGAGTSGGPGGASPLAGTGAPAGNTPSSLGGLSDFGSRRGTGRTILTDGRVTDDDFAVAEYMAGLSKIKLGKFDEAKASLKTALRYDEKNFDARMRLGMLYIQDGDIEIAANHLERLDRDRQSCKKRNCDDLDAITESAVQLAGQLTKAVRGG